MIKPLTPKLLGGANLSCYDIETGSDGRLLDIGFYSEDSGYLTFASWLGFIAWLSEHAEEEAISIIWAHNAGRFDSVALLCEIYQNATVYEQLLKTYTARLTNGSILELEIHTHSGAVLKFRDSFRLFPMRLNEVLKSFGLSPKHDIPAGYIEKMEEYKREYRFSYYDYLQQDVMGLYKALHSFRHLVNAISPVGELPLSLGSLALKIFRTSYLNETIETPNVAIDQFCDAAYGGGRTEYFGHGDKNDDGHYQHCFYYDVNSMYPAAMSANLMPFGQALKTNRLHYNEKGELLPGIYQADFDQINGNIPLLRPQSDGKKAKEHAFEGSGIYTACELDYIRKQGGKVMIKKGYVWPDAKPLFAEFVHDLYAKRLEAKQQNNNAVVLVCKLIMNNLYGKFAQKQEAEELHFLTLSEVEALLDEVNTGKQPDIINVKFLEVAQYDIDPELANEKYPVCITKRCDVMHRHVAIAATITALCRVQITALAERFNNDVIYVDTDSIITQHALPNELLSETELGKLKCEHADITMQFFGRKQYRIVGTDKIKQKGVKIKPAEIDDFCEQVEAGEKFAALYRSPSSIKKAARNRLQNPSKFEELTRCIQKDKSSREKGLTR